MAITKPQDPAADPRRWAALFFIGLAQLMIVLDETVVNIALPSLQRDLGIPDGDRQWVITGYILAFGGLLLLGGRIADYTGRKRAFLIGLLGFAAASALGGAAGSFETLLAARVLQGGFAALLGPSALSLLTVTFTHPKERAKAFGIWGAITAMAGALGLLAGGALTEYLSWRWCLYISVPLALVAAVGGYGVLTESRRQGQARFDVFGVLLVTSGLVALVYGTSRTEADGWGSAPVGELLGAGAVLLGAGAVLLAAFALVENRVPPAAAADASRRRPHAGRRLPGRGARHPRHVRRVPLHDVLPAGHQGLLADQDRGGPPADDRGGPAHGRRARDPAPAAGPLRLEGCPGPRIPRLRDAPGSARAVSRRRGHRPCRPCPSHGRGHRRGAHPAGAL
ncbi:MFS transporter [Streptomyces venezuelae]|uniref:MFS transporter n=1 Tax=Streptomyces venezuelae TaxID=54571 RepID=UPI0039898D13